MRRTSSPPHTPRPSRGCSTAPPSSPTARVPATSTAIRRSQPLPRVCPDRIIESRMRRSITERRLLMCLGPDSNRHGVSPKGFSYHYSFRCCTRSHAFVVWTLPLPSRDHSLQCVHGLGRGHQVSTLSPSLRA